jgi:signal transduction histidine kinase
MGVIALQAGVGAHVIDVDPHEAKASLDVIAQTSRTALADIRRILNAIRSDDEVPPERPVPGLSDIDDLVAGFVAGGMRIRVERSTADGALPAALDRTAYRLIQEALTNVLKHAGPCSTELTITTTPTSLVLSIVDSGVGTPTTPISGVGHGQLGMRERVAVWNGTLEAGQRPEGGYAVHAWLPFSQRDLT